MNHKYNRNIATVHMHTLSCVDEFYNAYLPAFACIDMILLEIKCSLSRLSYYMLLHSGGFRWGSRGAPDLPPKFFSIHVNCAVCHENLIL